MSTQFRFSFHFRSQRERMWGILETTIKHLPYSWPHSVMFLISSTPPVFFPKRCKARGDPEPAIHWISPEGKLVSNSTRTLVYSNGTLDIIISTVKDTGSFTCISSNPAGEAHQTVDLVIIKLPHISNNTNNIQEPDPGSSDISTSSRGGANGSNVTGDVKGGVDKRVVSAEATSSTALIKFNFQRNIPGIRMFQIQYNGSQDDSLVYR